MKSISKLQFITDNAGTAERVCAAGVDWVQLRVKNVPYEEYYRIAKEVQEVCGRYNATFIVNDSIKLALEINADGVHVGKEDPLPQRDIDEMRSRGGIIGVTTNTIEDFIHLDGKSVSYVGLGPYRYTDTKKNLSPILGLNGYRKLFAHMRARNMAHPPVIGIGGITADDVSVLMSTGIHGVAVSGAIGKATDISEAVKKFKDHLDTSDKVVQKTIRISAPVSEVWNTITNPALIREWLNDTPIDIFSDWKEGSEMIFKGTWHNRAYEDKGTILAYMPGKLFRYTFWSHLSQIPDAPENYSVIEFSLSPDGGGTEVTLNQSNFVSDTIYRHSNYYWTLTMDRLKKTIENR